MENPTPQEFEPTWESLSHYQTPEWFRDAKFGLWAHWGPQCEPERGDWYARGMYIEGDQKYADHIEQYGHPSEFGFKDVIRAWKAENWDPDSLLALYKRVGAEYFVALANHHDNFDLWDSTHQPWNSTVMGPNRNIVAEWAEAAKKHGLTFGVSVHASHAWSWYESSQGADTTGKYAGIPYDGKLTQADGTGTWWEGYDPQDLYAQNHLPTPMETNMWSVIKHWEWGNGYPAPSEAYCENFFNRTMELIEKYSPDLVYFDDTVLPMHPVSDVGLRIAAQYYSANPNAVLNGKVLSDEQKKTMVWDIERGQSPDIEPLPWQTCTCLGDWHYKQSIYDNREYKSAKTVIQMLVDVVSKNGNLLLSVPLRGDGTPDDQEVAILEEIAEWMAVHRECLIGTRPWVVAGEGPSMASAKPLNAQGFNEGTALPNTAADLRFTHQGDDLYVLALGLPEGDIWVDSLGLAKGNLSLPISKIEMLGESGEVAFTHTDVALIINAQPGAGNSSATAFRVTTSQI